MDTDGGSVRADGPCQFKPGPTAQVLESKHSKG